MVMQNYGRLSCLNILKNYGREGNIRIVSNRLVVGQLVDSDLLLCDLNSNQEFDCFVVKQAGGRRRLFGRNADFRKQTGTGRPVKRSGAGDGIFSEPECKTP